MTIMSYIAVILFALLAYLFKKLTKSGLIMASFVGASTLFGFGIQGLFLLAVFFISSTMWSSFQKEKKGNGIVEKGQQRDGGQVLANGGIAACMAILYGLFPSPYLIFGFVTSLAAANADTWASEIGTLSKQRPLHIITWKRVVAGTSGAVTAIGSAAAFAGSFLIVVCSIFFWWSNTSHSHVLLLVLTIAGFAGNLIDTVAGASIQVVYRCKECSVETEQLEHCQEKTERISGVSWINNDVVNLICTASGALIGIGLGIVFV
ncbi:DUF92 domain-containing protein [Halalkalibacter urbisdiaboli]|uniref:DUF92 domain-containing protein n=1 Tax=Halalkalibacter urbisdiaboli TaxID=1960589 RepID=UPI001FD890E2|nr:DUF92 domain-containing protein [Halalkalibacter urbisdiaboli]